MSDKLSINDLLSKEDIAEVMETANQKAHKCLEFIADTMEGIQNVKNPLFVGNQVLGIITQHMLRMTLGNAFINGNETDVFGKLCISGILDGFKMAQDEKNRTKKEEMN